MKRIHWAAFAVTLLAAVSCRNPNDVGKDIESSLTSEGNRWLGVASSSEVAGDRVTQVILSWTEALGRLKSYTVEMAKLVKDAKPEDIKEYSGRIESLRAPLESLLSRSEQVSLRVPSWSQTQVSNALKEATQSLNEISTAYSTIYGQAPNRPTFQVKIQVDERLYDTYGDCVGLFAHSRDSNCKIAATEGCTHQTNIDCVKRLIADRSSWSGLNCTTVYESKEEGSYEVISEWIKVGLRACQATAPIFKTN